MLMTQWNNIKKGYIYNKQGVNSFKIEGKCRLGYKKNK